MGNGNGKTCKIVKHGERELTKGSSSQLQDDKNIVELGDDIEKKLTRNVGKAMEGEQVAAGWPAWLSDVAAEAINGLVPKSMDTFDRLAEIGKGNHSRVYMARDRNDGRIVAVKQVRFDYSDPKSVRFMAREILIMRRLDHPNVIKLEGVGMSRMQYSLYLILEYMECDLAKVASNPRIKFTEPQIKSYMHQLLHGLDHCHSRGILHRDMKSSNLLVNNEGVLKIADFGLSRFSGLRRSCPLTSDVVTLWYRPPELLLGSTNYGVAVDLWSTGCVLGELYAGEPIMPGKSKAEQLHKIFKLCGSPSKDYWSEHKFPREKIFKPQQPYRRSLDETFKDFPAVTLRLMETLLSLDPESRGTASLALKSEFFTTEPVACDPSSLPKISSAFSPKIYPVKATRAARRRRERIHARTTDANVLLSDAVSQMSNELGREIQRGTQQGRREKIGVDKVQPSQMQNTASPVYFNPLLGPSVDVDELLEEHDRHIQEAALKMRLEKRKAILI